MRKRASKLLLFEWGPFLLRLAGVGTGDGVEMSIGAPIDFTADTTI